MIRIYPPVVVAGHRIIIPGSLVGVLNRLPAPNDRYNHEAYYIVQCGFLPVFMIRHDVPVRHSLHGRMVGILSCLVTTTQNPKMQR